MKGSGQNDLLSLDAVSVGNPKNITR